MSADAVEIGIAAHTSSAAIHKDLRMIPPCFGTALLSQRALEFDREGACTAVVDTREPERSLRLCELAGPARHVRLAGEAEHLALLVAASLRARDDRERQLRADADHGAGPCERCTGLLRRVAGPLPADAARADQRAGSLAGRGDVGDLVGHLHRRSAG